MAVRGPRDPHWGEELDFDADPDEDDLEEDEDDLDDPNRGAELDFGEEYSAYGQEPGKRDLLRGQKISEVGDRGQGVLACPVCGGTSFKAKRSAGAKIGLGLTIGLGALLAPKTRVKCETCGTEYLRG